MDRKTIVLVTGANTGLGFEIVNGLYSSEKSYEIVVGGRSLIKAQQAADAVSKDFPSSRSKLWPMQVDIENDESIQRIFDEVQTTFGKLDFLVNNAGTPADTAHSKRSLIMI